MEGDRDRLPTKGEKILMSHSYYYEIIRKKKGNVLYRVEFNRRVALAIDDNGSGIHQLRRMKALFDTSKMPINELRKAEAKSASPKKRKGSNWATNGASQRSL